MLGFNDTSTLVVPFVLSPREREKRDRRDRLIELGLTTRQPLWVILCRLQENGRRGVEEIVEEMKESDREERKMNESEGTEEIKTFPIYPYLLQGQQALPNCKPISVGRPGNVRYTTSLPHPTTPS